ACTLRFASRASLTEPLAATLVASFAVRAACVSAASLARRSSLRRAVLAASAWRSLSRADRRSASCCLVLLISSCARRRASAARSSALLMLSPSAAGQRPTGGIRSISLALHALAQRLACAPHRFGLFARAALGRLLVGSPPFHLAKRTFALHLLFEHAQRRVDVVVADEHLHEGLLSLLTPAETQTPNWRPCGRQPGAGVQTVNPRAVAGRRLA